VAHPLLALVLAILAACGCLVVAFLRRVDAASALAWIAAALVVTVWLVLPAWTAAT